MDDITRSDNSWGSISVAEASGPRRRATKRLELLSRKKDVKHPELHSCGPLLFNFNFHLQSTLTINSLTQHKMAEGKGHILKLVLFHTLVETITVSTKV